MLVLWQDHVVIPFRQLQSMKQCVQVLLIKTDGGPDRNNTFASVQLAYTALAIALNLKLLVLTRTAPGQSYVNPVERGMSGINLAIQGIACERTACPEDTEAVLKGANSMKAVRQALKAADGEQADAPDSHTQRFATSMQAPIAELRSALEVRVATQQCQLMCLKQFASLSCSLL